MFNTLRGLFHMILDHGQTEYPMDSLKTEADLNAALETSQQRPVFLFKHSTACPISHGALRGVEEYVKDRAENDPPVYLVRVIEERPLSNAIAETLGVPHKSPQIILVTGGRATWDASHHGIYADRLREAAAEQAS